MTGADPQIDNALLARSRDYCRELTRSAARNFYFGLKLLPEPRRSAMFAIYAYMRLIDDIADDDRPYQQRLDDLENWRAKTQAVLNNQLPDGDDHLLWPSFLDTVLRHAIPARVFDAIIAGQEQDLNPETFETFEQLEAYCYRVAGVVGLASIYVWGFEGGEETEALSLHRGTAFQLTNILRDLREDAGRGRIYLPQNELAEYGVTLDQLRAGHGGQRFDAFMQFQIDRAESFYEKSAELENRVERESRPTLIAMTRIYHGLLEKIAARPRRVLTERVSLSLLAKLRIGWKAVRAK
jgi:phytoene synthase